MKPKVAALLMGAAVLGSAGTALADTATPAAGGNAVRGGPVVLSEAQTRKLTAGHAGWGTHYLWYSYNSAFGVYLPWYGYCSSRGGTCNGRKHLD
jgi:hypothetical protein